MVTFKNVTVVKTSDKGVLLKNEEGVESWFPKSQIKEQKVIDKDAQLLDITCEDFLKDNFKCAEVSGIEILQRKEKAIRVVQNNEITAWIPLYTISSSNEEEGILMMSIKMAEEKNLAYEIR